MDVSPTGFLQRMRASLSQADVALPDVDIGARFEQNSHTAPVWIVDRIAKPAGSLHDHVTLRREDDPGSLKTLSLDALWTSGDFSEITQH